MLKSNRSMLFAGLLLASSAPALAQTQTTPSPATVPPQATPGTPPATPAPMARQTPSGDIVMTDAEAAQWVDKVIYSSDGKNLGEVASFVRDSGGKVQEMHADVGGLMGMGETRVRLMPSQFTLGTDRVTLKLTETDVKALPAIAKK